MNNKPLLLYVDDEKTNSLLFTINLRDSFELIVASSGHEALNMLDSNSKVAIVISDLRMPGMSGLDFVLEANNRFPNLNYFILSGSDITDEIQSHINSNILAGYFRKPVSFDYIKEELKSICSL